MHTYHTHAHLNLSRLSISKTPKKRPFCAHTLSFTHTSDIAWSNKIGLLLLVRRCFEGDRLVEWVWPVGLAVTESTQGADLGLLLRPTTPAWTQSKQQSSVPNPNPNETSHLRHIAHKYGEEDGVPTKTGKPHKKKKKDYCYPIIVECMSKSFLFIYLDLFTCIGPLEHWSQDFRSSPTDSDITPHITPRTHTAQHFNCLLKHLFCPPCFLSISWNYIWTYASKTINKSNKIDTNIAASSNNQSSKRGTSNDNIWMILQVQHLKEDLKLEFLKIYAGKITSHINFVDWAALI